MFSGDNIVTFDNTYAETGEIVVAGPIETGHLGGLAAGEGAPSDLATLRNTDDHPLGHIHIEFRRRVIVEKEEWLGTVDEHVVHAHGDQILANLVVAIMLDGEPEFRAHAVRPRHEDGLTIPCRNGGQRREPAKVQEERIPLCTPRRWRDAAYEFIAGVDVDAGISISES